MPRKTLENPFKPKKPLKDDDIALVRGVLGDKDADEMARLTGDQKPKPVETEPEQKPLDNLDLSDEERIDIGEPWTQDRVIDWAYGFGEDEAWVEKHFEFQKDGSIIITRDLDLPEKGITEFPCGVKEAKEHLDLAGNELTSLKCMPKTISDSLYLEGNNITSVEGLPDSVNKHLHLSDNPITSLKDLPRSIGGELKLLRIPADSIPKNIEHVGIIIIDSGNQALIKDAQDKGYKVRIIE